MERLIVHALASEVKMLIPSLRSDVYTGTHMLHTLGIMNQVQGGEYQQALDNISVTDFTDDAVSWYAESPKKRKIVIPDDQVMSGMQSRIMHLRIFNKAQDLGIDSQTIRDHIEMMLIAGRPPDRDHEDLYRAKATNFNVYAYYRTLGISGITFNDVVTILSTHCPGDFGFTAAQLDLFRDVEKWYGIRGAQPAILHQFWTVKPYDTDDQGKFMYPDFQEKWNYVKEIMGDRMPVELKAKSQA